jgi:hypothetical protein
MEGRISIASMCRAVFVGIGLALLAACTSAVHDLTLASVVVVGNTSLGR